MSDYAELLEGLRKTVKILEPASGKPMDIPLNPNGYHAATVIEALRAENEKLTRAMRNIKPYLVWTVGPESPGHHPTMPSAVAAFLGALERKPE